MKKSIILILALLFFNEIFAAYNVGQVVEDIAFEGITWDDEGEMNVQNYLLSELIGEQKPVIIYFINVTYQ